MVGLAIVNLNYFEIKDNKQITYIFDGVKTINLKNLKIFYPKKGGYEIFKIKSTDDIEHINIFIENLEIDNFSFNLYPFLFVSKGKAKIFVKNLQVKNCIF